MRKMCTMYRSFFPSHNTHKHDVDTNCVKVKSVFFRCSMFKQHFFGSSLFCCSYLLSSWLFDNVSVKFMINFVIKWSSTEERCNKNDKKIYVERERAQAREREKEKSGMKNVQVTGENNVTEMLNWEDLCRIYLLVLILSPSLPPCVFSVAMFFTLVCSFIRVLRLLYRSLEYIKYTCFVRFEQCGSESGKRSEKRYTKGKFT